jgi:Cupin superfamily protein
MKHLFVDGITKALGWAGPEDLGTEFVRGALPDPGLCARLLTPNRLLDIVMRRSLSAPQIRVFQDGAEIHPARFLDDGVNRRGQSFRSANMRRLAGVLGAGGTLVLDQIDVFDPTLEVVCRALQWWTHELTQVNTYLTTQASDGFPLHWDDHEVIVVQLAGEKDWEVRGCSRAAPMYRDAEINSTPPDDVLWQGTLCAGEVMHIPRGYWHRASRANLGDGFSLHATFGITRRTGVHWLTWLTDNARRSELFRENLDRADAAGDQVLKLVGEIMSLAETYDPRDYLRAREIEHGASRYVPALGIFGAPESVVCVSEFPPRIETHDHAIEVFVAARKVSFAPAAQPALDALLSGAPVHLDTLASTTGLNIQRMVDVLLEEQICAPLTLELFSGYTGLVTDATFSK